MEIDKVNATRPNGGEGRHTKRLKKNQKFLMIGSIVAALAAAVFVVWLVWNVMGSAVSGVDTSRYQAVFFTNGQVYFGKLSPQNSEYMKLTEVFYLQTTTKSTNDSKDLQKTTPDSDVQLVKLGDELHGPENEMIISKDQVLYYENIKPEGKVATAIDRYNKSSDKN